MWRISPAISAALLCLAVASFVLYLAESTQGAAARNLGYGGETWRVVAVSATADNPEERSQVLVDFCDRESASVAFSSGDVRSVGIYDPTGRYSHPDDEALLALQRSGSTPAALLSTAINGSGLQRTSFVPDGVDLVGTIDPEVKFDDYYPTLIQNVAAAPPRSGVYRFVGLATGDEEAVEELFRDLGMEIVRVDVESAITPTHVLSSFFGRVLMAFVSLAALAAILVTNIFLALDRGRLEVAVQCGATARDVQTLILRRLAPPAVMGTVAGAIVAALLAGVLSGALLVSTGSVALIIGGALTSCAVMWIVVAAVISGWQGRARSRALPR